MEGKVIVIVGPTCSGKTNLAIRLAEKFGSEIISADSRQIYKYLNIGTAKPSEEGLKKVKHHFIDILEPDADYNVSKFENDALEVIKNLFDKDKTPIIAGGSGLYIKALVDGIFNTVDVDEEYRSFITEQRTKLGNDFLYGQLKLIDPVSASKMLPQNWKRVMRALEVYHLTGKPIGEHQEDYKRETSFDFVQFGLLWDRQTLYKNIEDRVDQMIELGLVDEVKKVLEMGYDKNRNALNTVGYKEIISYLEGEYSLVRAIELIKRNTRRFAKRQMTWFNADEKILWKRIDNNADFNVLADQVFGEVHKFV